MLVRLQIIDKTLFELMNEKAAIPERLAELDQQEQKLKEELDQAQAELDQLKASRKNLEKETDEIRARLRRAENRLMGAKSQREYRAANAEIEEGKDALKGNEDALLEIMERQEILEAQVAEQKSAFEELSGQAQKEREEMQKRLAQLKSEVSRLQKKRGGMTQGVDQELMDQYDFIRERRQGVALAPVEKGTCMVCHMQLPAQQFNELQRMDKLMSCPSCSRILYWADAEPFQDLK